MMIRVNKSRLTAVLSGQVAVPGLSDQAEQMLLLAAINCGCEAAAYLDDKLDASDFVEFTNDLDVFAIDIDEDKIADAINGVVDIPWVGEAAEGMLITQSLASLPKAAAELAERFDLDFISVEE